jgi:hypothetical protein
MYGKFFINFMFATSVSSESYLKLDRMKKNIRKQNYNTVEHKASQPQPKMLYEKSLI